MLSVSALLGRTFTTSDDQTPGGHPVVVLSYQFWQNRFGGDPGIVNRAVKINGRDFTILGVLPPGFRGTEVWLQPEVWIPMMMQPQIEIGNPWLDRRGTWNCWVLGRLKDGVSSAQAQSALQTLATQISKINNRPDSLRIRLERPGFVGAWLRNYLLGLGATLFAAHYSRIAGRMREHCESLTGARLR
jgi:hypothetical protein